MKILVTQSSNLVLVLLLLPLSSRSDEPQKPFPPVPTTLSSEAQEFLRKPLARRPFPRSVEEWRVAQEKAEARGRDVSEAFLRDAKVEIEETNVEDVGVRIIKPKNPTHSDKVILNIHGGGYVYNSAKVGDWIAVPIATSLGICVYSVDYRLAPQYPFPAALDDCTRVYRQIVEDFDSQKIGVIGSSAGGSLALAMLLQAREEKMSMPGAVVCVSPWADLTNKGDTYLTLDEISPVLKTDRLNRIADLYAGGACKTNPLLSPVYATYTCEFPPTLIHTGTRDLFLSNCVRLHRVMKKGGVAVELGVWEGMWHGFHAIPNSDFPEAKEANAEIFDFFVQHLKLKNSRAANNPSQE